jgi:hypothetical protein
MIGPQLGISRTEISLRAHSRAVIFLLAAGCVCLFLAVETSLVGIVSSFNKPAVGRWLLALDANDPQLQDRLGQAYGAIDPTESVRYLRRATQLSPNSRFYWSDLESACVSEDDQPCADQAGERLVQLCPMVPYYHWDALQHALRNQRLDEVAAQSRRLLELDPSYAAGTWASLQTVMKPEVIFQKVLAEERDAKLEIGYVDFLSEQGENDAAYRIWRLAAADSASFPFSSVAPYLERLIHLGRIEEAVNVWQDLERLGIVKKVETNEVWPVPHAGPAPAAPSLDSGQALKSGAMPPRNEGSLKEKDNLVFNGDFEQAPLRAGFDWRLGPTAFLAVDFSTPGAYHGARCLRVDFTVSRNAEYEPVYQIVPVQPQHAYSLEAFVRSEDITSDTGPCLRVSDTQAGGFADAISETTVGTTPWHSVHLSFSTGPRTQAVRLSFWRPRSRVFPMEISGTAWLDAVSLHETDSAVVPN